MENWGFAVGVAETLILGLGVLVLVLLLLQIITLIKLRALGRRYRQLLGVQGKGGQTLEEVLFQHLENVRLALERVSDVELEVKKLARKNRVCARRPGVVRFNAFPDTGGQMSFSLALLDEDHSGVVLTNMYGRNESFVYAKPVERGQSSYNLTDEEKEAIARARGVNPAD